MRVINRIYYSILKRVNLQKFAQQRGVKMGRCCRIVNSTTTSFGSEPYLISMGEHVEVSGNVTFITHDGAVWLLREKHPDLDVFGRITIGNNVFIGRSSILLPGTQIGDNCVIGAGALVKGKCESNAVYAGVPARRICDIEDYERRSVAASVPTKKMGSS